MCRYSRHRRGIRQSTAAAISSPAASEQPGCGAPRRIAAVCASFCPASPHGGGCPRSPRQTMKRPTKHDPATATLPADHAAEPARSRPDGPAQAGAGPADAARRLPRLARIRAAPQSADGGQAARIAARRAVAPRHLRPAVRPPAAGTARPAHHQGARNPRHARRPAVPLRVAALQAGDALLHAGLDAHVHVVHGRLPDPRHDVQ